MLQSLIMRMLESGLRKESNNFVFLLVIFMDQKYNKSVIYKHENIIKM